MSGAGVDQSMLVITAVLALLLIVVALRNSPKLMIIGWLLVIGFVPVWLGVTVSAYFPAASIISVLAALALAPTLRLQHWTVVDLLLLGVAALVILAAILGLTTRSAVFDLFTSWAAAFLFGRAIVGVVRPRWIYGAVAVVFTCVAVLAIVEFFTAINLFITYLPEGSRLFEIWGVQQPRGGLLRAEGAFGHSIALGCSLAMAVALTLGSTFPGWVKVLLVGIMATAVVLAFSRAGILTCAASIVLMAIFERRSLGPRLRIGLLVIAGLGALAASGAVLDVFLSSDEAEGSATYRSDLLALARFMSPLGLASVYSVSTTREVSIGDFGSIDNATLLFGLLYGWIPLLLVVTALGIAAVSALRGRGTPPVVAVVAQIPALVSVAFITQYATLFWFCVGLAVSTQEVLRRENSDNLSPRQTRRVIGEAYIQ